MLRVNRDACVRGLDVSVYQRGIDFVKARAGGYEFVWIKATQATRGVDPEFVAHAQKAHASVLLIGAYHFAVPDGDKDDAKLEAQNLARAIGPYPWLDLGVCLDVETTGYDGQKLADWCEAFVWEVQRLTGYAVTFYTSPAYASMSKIKEWPDGITDCPLWVAHWDSNPDTRPVWSPGSAIGLDAPMMPPGFKTWQFWQFDASRTVPGFAGLCDRNLFNGNRAALEKFCAWARNKTKFDAAKSFADHWLDWSKTQ